MNKDSILTILSTIIFVVTIVFVLRPLIVLMGKRVPEGQQMKESQFIVVVVIVLICGFSSEFFGQPAGMGTFILGMVIPDGPPLGSCLVNKLSAFVTGLLVPVKFMLSGLNMDLFSFGKGSGVIIGFVIFVSYTIKFFGALAPALYYKIPLKDAVTLVLIMCCRGIAQLLISHLYDPSSRYLSQHKNTILSNNPNDELRILFCVHNAENVPTIINLLEASNPKRDKPIAVFILNLMELKDRAASVLESNTRRSKLTSSRSWSKQVANAFDLFAQKNHNSVLVRHFTSIAPYASMHDDICTLGLDQNANIVIVPFHKQWSIDGTVGSKSPSIRMVNQNVIKKSPCSVGVLVDRGQVGGINSAMFQICVVFLGGADDCEALAYITRFIDNPQVNLKLVWIRPFDHRKYDEDKETEDSLDAELVDHFRASITGNERVSYKEELVKDAIGTTRVIRSLDDGNCDLCVVGRYHEPDSPVLFGMNEWNECPEFGLIGDMLATSDFKFSVLVVQQQAPGNDLVDGQPLQTIASSASYSDYNDYQSHSFHSSYSNYSDRM
ncbi:hypothetical protein RD792_002912 [Penstemon davidsonii]|uniref:Cation/H+ exchanger domain-containing protein n=1 Tax=Penstemon davidsonii TaxID=160366 RepID=A0ABR0DT64_9LAMI|nr:hypothetical protein RD792_002912 [Penstemon davidsonii]